MTELDADPFINLSTAMPLILVKEILRLRIIFFCDVDFENYDWEFTDEEVRNWYEGCFELWYDGTEIIPPFQESILTSLFLKLRAARAKRLVEST